MKKILTKKTRRLFTILILLILLISSVYSIKIYFNYIDKAASKILFETELKYDIKKNIILSNGFLKVDIKDELNKNMNGVDSNITVNIEDAGFYLDLIVKKNDEETIYYIDKIVDTTHNVTARFNIVGLESIEYKTGNSNNSLVIKINSSNKSTYVAFTNNTYYFLGDDIESITYENDHFYYISYNQKYTTLKNAVSCDKTFKSSIENFSDSDIYYSYGKINFFTDYYQKLASKKFSVQNRCDELSELNSISE